MYATCRTEGCTNWAIAVAVRGDVQVACGPCGQPITDLADTPDLPEEMPTWEL